MRRMRRTNDTQEQQRTENSVETVKKKIERIQLNIKHYSKTKNSEYNIKQQSSNIS